MDYTIVYTRSGPSRTAYLCFSSGEDHKYRLAVCEYEWLGDVENYYDAERERYVIPGSIRGKQVVEFERSAIVGGELRSRAGASLEFDSPKAPHVGQWLHESGFDFAAMEHTLILLCSNTDVEASTPADRVAAEIIVEWGYDSHSIVLTPRNWRAVRAGKPLSIRGKGYVYEGEFFWDYWEFAGGRNGGLTVHYGDDGGVGYIGSLNDASVTLFDRNS